MIPLFNSLIFCLSSSLFFLWFYRFFSRDLKEFQLFPIEQIQLFNYIKAYLVCSTGMFLIVSCIIVYKYWFGKKQKKTKLSELFGKFSVFVDKVNIFYKSYGMLAKFLDMDYLKYLIKLAKIVLELTNKQVLLIIFFFAVMPRILIVLVFLTDLYLGRWHYFPYALFLVIIIVIFRLVLFMLKDIGIRLFPEFDQYVVKEKHKITQNTIEGKEEFYVTGLSFIEEFADKDFNDFALNTYYPLMNISEHMQTIIMPLYANIVQYTLLMYHFIISSGLLYVIYYN